MGTLPIVHQFLEAWTKIWIDMTYHIHHILNFRTTFLVFFYSASDWVDYFLWPLWCREGQGLDNSELPRTRKKRVGTQTCFLVLPLEIPIVEPFLFLEVQNFFTTPSCGHVCELVRRGSKLKTQMVDVDILWAAESFQPETLYATSRLGHDFWKFSLLMFVAETLQLYSV